MSTATVWRYPDPIAPAGMAVYPKIGTLYIKQIAIKVAGGAWAFSDATTTANAKTLTGQYCTIDTEPWDAGAAVNDLQALKVANSVLVLLACVRKVFTGKVGLVGWLPFDHHEYCGMSNGIMTALKAQWQARNDLIASRVFAAVDFLCPYLYVREPVLANEQASAALMLTEAKRLRAAAGRTSSNCPIWPFVWPRDYTKATPGSDGNWPVLDPLRWKAVLQACRDAAEGVIVYTYKDAGGDWQRELDRYATGKSL